MKDLLFVIGEQPIPTKDQLGDLDKIINEELWNLQNVTHLQGFVRMLTISAFNYGRIVGKQEERAKRKGIKK